MTDATKALFDVLRQEDELRTLRPKCGWVTGYNDCPREGCEFPAERCAECGTEAAEA